MRPARKVPTRGPVRSLPVDRETQFRPADEVHEIPPDPKTSTSPRKATGVAERSDRCLLNDIDPSKLSSLICGHPAGRGTALLLQALRQQVTIAASCDYSQKALTWIIDNDVLQLKAKRNSALVRVLQADGVDSREQMARLINTLSSFTKGRQYFTAHLRLFLTCVVPVLRGRRLPTSTQEQLIATLQKTSVRQSCQKELLQCGMLEWVVNFLEGRTTPYATEYACSLAINLSLNPASHSIQLRFADSLAAAACNVLSRDTHGSACSIFNSLALVWLCCGRVRLRARETRLLDALRTRNLKKICPLCDLHIPYLLAVIAGEAEIVKVPQAPSDGDVDNVGDSCEREIDATDPLHPSTNELSGAKLLLRRAVKEVSPDVQPTVPGQVLRNHKVIRTTHGPKRGRSSEPRLGTAASQNTFVIETERRKPLVLPVGLADGAVEYKKAQEALQKAKEEEAKRLQREQAEREAAEAKERERLAGTAKLRTYRPHASAKKPPTMKKEMAASGESLSSQESNKTPGGKRSPLRKKTPAPGDNFSTTVTSATPVNEAPEPQTFEFEDESQLDYMAVFGARPKIARTPDHIVNRTAYYQ
ncbi:hypothetical protein Y032_0377g258 [Ancylostoma ceylanicum]|uniref:LisH domain-containing protein n=1 Tax=Ancylostoma ceylanicum TaxID=53326 RepID=A0A016RUK2_9BILA|nr:hypothetical protein Y032_0377g258 [Ancylostoma ceylanicum]